MATRIIVAVIAIPLLFGVIFFAPLWGFALVVGIISAGSAWELLRCIDEKMPTRFRVYSAAAALLTPLACVFVRGSIFTNTVFYALCLLMFLELMFSYKKEARVKVETVLSVIFAGAVMPLVLASLVRIGLSRSYAPVYLVLPFVATFSSDSGAYFAGYFFGKKKAFPNLSPNKTVEGCVGGLVCTVVLMLLYGFVLTKNGFEVSFAALAVYGVFGSIASQIGDLAFSAVKRQYGIKDYGNLIPGHGGMLDRFDSMHFTAPMIELLLLLIPAIK